jgi:hypothetical protein
MPKVMPNESREHYMGRYVRAVMGEGMTQKQAVSKCEGLYDSAHKKESQMNIVKEDDQDKIDALTATINDLNDQLDVARGNADKQAELRDRIDTKQDQLDRLTRKESAMKIVKEGKGIKVIPASQARKDPEGRKVQRAQAIAQGYDGVRYENEEGVEVFHESTLTLDDIRIAKEIAPHVIQAIRDMLKQGPFDTGHDAGYDIGKIFGRAIVEAIIHTIPSNQQHKFRLGTQDQL